MPYPLLIDGVKIGIIHGGALFGKEKGGIKPVTKVRRLHILLILILILILILLVRPARD
jgi:hypothetical protein